MCLFFGLFYDSFRFFLCFGGSGKLQLFHIIISSLLCGLKKTVELCSRLGKRACLLDPELLVAELFAELTVFFEELLLLFLIFIY